MAIKLNSGYQIVFPAGASAAVGYAATELVKYVKKITGAELPIVTDDAPA